MIQRRGGENWKIYAHRAAWILFRGPIPEGKMVLHNCPGEHVPYCVNPSHLKLGDGFENMQDMTKEGHNYFSTHAFQGEKHAMSKLTEEQVKEIRTKYKTGDYFLKELGAEFGVHLGQIWSIVNYKSWKHIP